jgi:hypothetical protein
MNLEDALTLATQTHNPDHAVRVVGKLFHRRRLSAEALNRADLVESETASSELIAAALHDVLEDTELTAEDLLRAGCSRESVAAIEALTRRPGEDYLEFVARAAADPIARRVKRADLEDNADQTRLAKLSPSERERLAAKYAAGLSELGEWERYWAVAASRRGQPGGRFQYFLHGRGLARQWRWREAGAEVAVAWPEVIDPGATGGFWAAAPEDSVEGTEIPLERAYAEAREIGVELEAPAIREWTVNGAVVRFGARPRVAEASLKSKPKPSSGGSSWLRALVGAAAGLAAAVVFSKLRRR